LFYRVAVPAMLACVLGACGGGGGNGPASNGGSSNSGGSGQSGVQGTGQTTDQTTGQNTSNAILSLNQTSASASVAYSDPSPVITTIRFSLSEPLHQGGYYGVHTHGYAVWSAKATWNSDSTGGLTINLPTPGSLGDGTYTGSVDLAICLDRDCKQQIKGSPATVSITYTVVGGVPDTRLAVLAPQFDTGVIGGNSFLATTSDGAVPVYTYGIHLVDVSKDSYVRVSRNKDGVVANVTLDDIAMGAPSVEDTTARVTLTDPRTLHSGIYTDSIKISACLDETCTQQIGNSPQTLEIRYFVAATEGREYTRRTIPMPLIASAALEPHTGKLYAVVPHTSSLPQKTTVERVDPVSGTIDGSLDLDGFASSIVFSNDGQYALLCRDNYPVIHRIRIADFQADTDITFADQAQCAVPVIAPGNPVRLAFIANYGAALRIVDGTVGHPLQTLPFTLGPMTWSDHNTLYMLENTAGNHRLHTLSVTSGGAVSDGISVPVDDAVSGSMSLVAGKLYFTGGNIVDPATGGTLGTCTLPEPDSNLQISPNTTLNRMYTLYRSSTLFRTYLATFDLGCGTTDGLVDLGSPLSGYSSPIRWGTDGLALVLRDQLVLINGPLISQASPAGAAHSAVAGKPGEAIVTTVRLPSSH